MSKELMFASTDLTCHRISKPGQLFTHDGQFLASEALVFFGDTVK